MATHHPRTTPLHALSLAVLASLLAACGGGGSNVRSSPPPPTPPPATPPPTPPTSLQGPVVVASGAWQNINLPVVGDVRVHEGGAASLDADVSGSVSNDGTLEVWNPSPTEARSHVRIGGNFVQGAPGTLIVHLGPPEASDLRIAGNAVLSGTLSLALPCCGNGDLYNTTNMSLTPNILHADGTISGRFDRVVLPSIFLAGSIDYGAHDVTMVLTRAPAATVAGAGADQVTLAGAGNLDALFANAASGGSPALAASLGTLWRIGDAAQAVRSFDSLTGHAFASARGWLLETDAADRMQRDLALRQPLAGPRAWSRTLDRQALRGDAGAARLQSGGTEAGVDQWFGEGVLVGLSARHEETRALFARGEDAARWTAPSATLYAHARRGAWYATAAATQSAAALDMRRWIELGDGNRHLAATSLDLSRFDASLEAGRTLGVGRGILMPYVALGHATIRTDAFTEQGDTGLELTATAATLASTRQRAGLRYARAWRWHGDGWARLFIDAGVEQAVGHRDAWRVAYVGAPALAFDLPEVDGTGPRRQVDLQFEVGRARAHGWTGTLDGRWRSDGRVRDHAWQLGAHWRF